MNMSTDTEIQLPHSTNEFERQYIKLRQHENRVYTDDEVAWLPEINKDHVHSKEWTIRKRSSRKLVRYLSNKNCPLKILEVGCGNGWLSFQLSQIPFSTVTAVDINLLELRQAERVFAGVSNLSFIYGDIHTDVLAAAKFDIVVFAASIQYFNSLHDTLHVVLDLLTENGEIHIIDSHFYNQEQAKKAAYRSRQYFHNNGFDKMQDFYFHHSIEQLKKFHCSFFYKPDSIITKILRKKHPFHWVCIRK